MLRSGFILGISAPAAFLTLLVHPMVQMQVERSVQAASVVAPVAAAVHAMPGMRPASIAISPTRLASLQADQTRALPADAKTAQGIGSKPPLRPRRMMREGCEGAVSSLVGPEARRMIPGRCIS